MRRTRLSVVLVALASTMVCALGAAHALTTSSIDLVPASAAVAACLPDATGEVTVFHKHEALGVDILQLHASGLPANVDFAVFLTSADAFASPAFGATTYVGSFTTNAAGIGALRVATVIGEAFVSSRVDTTRVRADLDHLVFWFADPAQAQAACGLTAITPFDGDGDAGGAAMSSEGATGLETLP